MRRYELEKGVGGGRFQGSKFINRLTTTTRMFMIQHLHRPESSLWWTHDQRPTGMDGAGLCLNLSKAAHRNVGGSVKFELTDQHHNLYINFSEIHLKCVDYTYLKIQIQGYSLCLIWHLSTWRAFQESGYRQQITDPSDFTLGCFILTRNG